MGRGRGTRRVTDSEGTGKVRTGVVEEVQDDGGKGKESGRSKR